MYRSGTGLCVGEELIEMINLQNAAKPEEATEKEGERYKPRTD